MARLTTAQAIVECLVAERVPYVLGIIGHGNVQLGQALYDRRDRPTVIHVEVDRDDLTGGYEGWWDVPQPELDARGNPSEARARYLAEKARQIIR